MTTNISIEQVGDTLVITPSEDLRELDFENIELSFSHAIQLLRDGVAKNVVLDFRYTDSYGSTALGYFIKLWKKVRDCHGAMALCNMSDHERQILGATNLDTVWDVFGTREEALEAVSHGNSTATIQG